MKASEVSNVWRDGGNVDDSGERLDLKAHLERHRRLEHWVEAKAGMVREIVATGAKVDGVFRVLEVGCGLGLDLVLLGEALAEAGVRAEITGVDFNSEMVEHSLMAVRAAAAGSVTYRVEKGDIYELESQFAAASFDVVKAEITMQHLGGQSGIERAFPQIRAVLAPAGRFVSLESGVSTTCSLDADLLAMTDRLMPAPPRGGFSALLYLHAAAHGFCVEHCRPIGFLQTSSQLADQDPSWTKLKGMLRLGVSKGIPQADADLYFEKYTSAISRNDYFLQGCMNLLVLVKANP